MKRLSNKVPQIMKMRDSEDGIVCIAMVCAYYGKWLPLDRVRADCGISRDGCSISDLAHAAEAYGFKATVQKLDAGQLEQEAAFPCIARWKAGAYVVVRGFSGDAAYINDPARGSRKVSIKEFEGNYSGIALLLKPADQFHKEGRPESVSAYIRKWVKGSLPAIAIVAVATAAVSLLGIINPLLSQVFVDYLLPNKDISWGNLFLAIVAIVAIATIAASSVNDIYSYKAQGRIHATTSSSFFWKVLHLPMGFFDLCKPGDIIDRGSMIKGISQNLINTFAPLLINVVTLILYLVVMVMYSPLLAMIGISSVIASMIVSRAIVGKRVNISRSLARGRARLSSATMSGYNMIETLKASGAELGFFGYWADCQASENADFTEVVNLQTGIGMIPQVLYAVSNIVVLMTGVVLIMQGHFTAGMLLAFQSLLMQFMAPAKTIIASMMSAQEMLTEMERIDDVRSCEDDPMASSEPLDENAKGNICRISGDLRIEHMTFGYSQTGKPVIEDFNLHVKQGQSVALVGCSGSGKSTIGSLICGLRIPWSGTIEYGGVPIQEISRPSRTASITAVDQSISLFRDTVSNNIRMWDKSIKHHEVVAAARKAAIHADIMKLKDGYNHVIADGGSDLSGGQRQRLEIARALAMNPTLLVLDEATSALDAQTESEVIENIKSHGCTMVIIAHRLSTIRDCDEILVLDRGRVVERGTHDELMQMDGYYRRLVASE